MGDGAMEVVEDMMRLSPEVSRVGVKCEERMNGRETLR